MQSAEQSKTKLLDALDQAERAMKAESDKAGRTMLDQFRQERDASLRSLRLFVLAIVGDTYVPVSFFDAFASPRRFREWRDDPETRLDVRIIHDRLCVRPTDFFNLWSRLPAKRRRSGQINQNHK